MKNLDDFLKRYNFLQAPIKTKVKICLEIIKDETGIELEKNDIKLSGVTFYITAGSVVRSEVLTYKSKIEKKLTLKLNSKKYKLE